MGFRHDMAGYSRQQQVIVRRRDKKEQLRKEESEKKHIEKIQSEIVGLLKNEDSALAVREIARKLNRNDPDVLKAINRLDNKEILIVKEEKVNQPRYKLKNA